MAQRLPIQGGDNNDWGDILNGFLEVSLYNNVNNPSDSGNGSLNSNTVGSTQIQNNAVTNAQLDIPTQTVIASVPSKYVKPSSGIPSTDLTNSVQTSLTAANNSIQSGSTAAGDLSGTYPNPTIGSLQGKTLSGGNPSNGQVLSYNGSEWTPATITQTTINNATYSATGLVQLSGDLGGGNAGTATAPQVTSTHLNSALPIAQGGTGSTAQNFVDISSNQTVAGVKTFSSPIAGSITGSANTVSTIPALTGDVTSNGSSNVTTVGKINGVTVSGTPSANQVLTANTSTSASWTTPSVGGSGTLAGDNDVALTTLTNGQVLTYSSTNSKWVNQAPVSGVTLDSTATDLQPDTTNGTAVAGSTGKAADAGHQHPLVAHDHSSTTKGGQIIPSTGLATTGTPSISTYLRGDNTWSTPAAGVILDSTATDIQPLGTRSAGSTGKAADAGHVHAMPNASQVGALPSTDDLSTIASNNATAANISLNSFKITNLANGTASSDAASFGQIPLAGTGINNTSDTWSVVYGTTSTTAAAGNDSRLVNAATAMTPLASPITSAYTANPGDIVQVNASSGAVIVKLPNAPADKSKVTVKLVSSTSVTNVATIQTQGSDVFDSTAGATSATLILQNQAKAFQYQASSGIWYALSADFPLSSLVTGSSHKVTTAYTMTNIDHVVLADATSAAFTITLPTAVGFSGRYTVDAITTSNNIVTLATSSSQTIDGISTTTLGTQSSGATWSSVDVVSDGSNWLTV